MLNDKEIECPCENWIISLSKYIVSKGVHFVFEPGGDECEGAWARKDKENWTSEVMEVDEDDALVVCFLD